MNDIRRGESSDPIRSGHDQLSRVADVKRLPFAFLFSGMYENMLPQRGTGRSVRAKEVRGVIFEPTDVPQKLREHFCGQISTVRRFAGGRLQGRHGARQLLREVIDRRVDVDPYARHHEHNPVLVERSLRKNS